MPSCRLCARKPGRAKPCRPAGADAAAPVLEKPELPVIHFPAPARDAGMAQTGAAGCIETLLDTGTPEWEPKTKLDHLSVDILSQLKQLMGT